MLKISFKTRKAIAEFLLEVHWLLLLVAFSFSVIFMGAKWSNYEEDVKTLGNLLEEIRNGTLNSTSSLEEDSIDIEDYYVDPTEYMEEFLNKTNHTRTYLDDLKEARVIILGSLVAYSIVTVLLILSQTILNSILSEGIIKENLGYCYNWFILQSVFNVTTACIIIFGNNLSHSRIIEGIVLQWIWVGYIIMEISSYAIMLFYYHGLKMEKNPILDHDVGIYILKPQ